MTRIRFEDLPSTNTPRNAENLNKLNNVVISPTEPTTGEEVWIDNINKKIYAKNDNEVYEELYKKTILFEGSTTDTTVSLIDDYKKYEEIEIITYLQGTYNTHKHYTDYNTINLTDIQSAGDKWQQIRTGRGTFSGKTLTIDRVIGININMENYTFQSFAPTLEVKKVIGINKKTD